MSPDVFERIDAIVEAFEPHRRDVVSRMDRKVRERASGVYGRRVTRSKRRRRERDLYHRRQVAKDQEGKSKLIRRPVKILGTRFRSR